MIGLELFWGLVTVAVYELWVVFFGAFERFLVCSVLEELEHDSL